MNETRCLLTTHIICREIMLLCGDGGKLCVIADSGDNAIAYTVQSPGRWAMFSAAYGDLRLSLDDFSAKHLEVVAKRIGPIAGELAQPPRRGEWVYCDTSASVGPTKRISHTP